MDYADRLLDEDEDIKEKVTNFEKQMEAAWDELKDILEIVLYMCWGFFDGGQSFEKGLEMIDE